VKAADCNLRDTESIEQACRTVIDGRRAARALAALTGRFELSETEFLVLWCLRSSTQEGLDQSTLARQLAASPAQISATVERVRARGWISQQDVAGDRRRHFWRLSTSGQNLLEQMLIAAAPAHYEPAARCERRSDGGPAQEAAA
jgi:DNA-binding MarR family transcriptional regulator